MPVAQACRLLGVSRSGFYRHQNAAERRPKDIRDEVFVRAAFASSMGSYGSRRIMHAVRLRGLDIGRYRVRTVMKNARLRPSWKLKYVATTNSHPNARVADNLLNRKFDVDQPNRAWVTDLTYINTGQGFLYLAVVLDLYSRRAVGWASSPRLDTRTVIEALQMAVRERHPAPGLIIHSDRGTQFTADQYQRLLYKHGLTCSMSRRGDCWDNAVMERFFLSLKRERTNLQRYATLQEANRDIEHYIKDFYNAQRLHSTLGYLPPAVYERRPAQPLQNVSTKT